ncbi:amidohydrolase family protein [Amycolatopsis sp. NPDC004079]|uniref:amidohydrolase family protein n=1 Tax=Amycolatopsis sp. NPDC004079 TaxID=3154549 RepID=UPI0033AE8BE5
MNRKFTRRRAVTSAAALASAGLFSTAAARATAAPSGAYRIDLHAHFLPPEYRASLLSHGYFTIGGYPTPEWSPEAALDFMDRYGIAAQALSISDPGVSFLRGTEARDMARYCNTYAASLFKSHPTRFGGFAVLPMPDVAASIAELEYALTVLKLDGVVLLSSYDDVYLGDPRFEPLMAALDRHNAYVFVHPASVSRDSKPELPLPDFLYEFTFDTTRAATMLMYTGTMRRYPRIRFQLAHAGGTIPFLTYRLGVLSKTGAADLFPPGVPRPSAFDVAELVKTFFYDTALSPAATDMRSVLATGQQSRVVFGSDWPFSQLTLTGSGDPQPELDQTFTASDRLEIERANGLRELPRLAQAVGS